MTVQISPSSNFRVDSLRPYILGTLAEKVAQSRLAGRDVIDLSQVNPEASPPRVVLDKLVQAVLLPHNHRYSSSQGIRRLRESICSWYGKHFAVKLDPETQVIASMGTKEAITHLLMAIASPGDSVLVTTPTYPIHSAAVFLSGANFIGVPLLPSLEDAVRDRYLLTGASEVFFRDLEAAYARVYPRPRLLVLSFPHNPTTAVVDLSFWRRIVEFAKGNNVLVIHDLAYSTICYDGYEAPSLLQVPGAEEIGVELFSLSKGFGIAGWRIGFVLGNPRMVAALRKIKSYIDFGIFQPLQIAGSELIEEPGGVLESTCDTYRKRRDILVPGLKNLGWQVVNPRASVFVWSRIPKNFGSMGSVAFAEHLLKTSNVAVCPGIGFGDDADNFLRFSLVETDERIGLALQRISKLYD